MVSHSRPFLRSALACVLFGMIGFGTLSGCSRGRRGSATTKLPPSASGARTADEQALALCSALHQKSSQRRAECCAESPVSVYFDECVRLLSSAVRARNVSIDAAKVSLCAARVDVMTRGCDWVAPMFASAPAECAGAVTGLVGEGGRCTSSLECSGALHCAGQGATTHGVCKAPQAKGAGCGNSVDSLATYLTVRALEERKPACEDFCDLAMHRCEAKPAPGAPCNASVNCASDQACRNGHCEKPDRTTHRARSLPGGTCTTDLDCSVGGCVTDDAGRRTCAKKCSSDLASLAGRPLREPLSLRGRTSTRTESTSR